MPATAEPLRRRALALLLALGTGPLAASPAVDPPGITLAETLALALQRAPEAQAAAAGLAIADADVAIAGLRPNPLLAVEAENIDGSGVFAGGAERETTAVVQLPLELGGKRAARSRIAAAEREAAMIRGDAVRADIVLSATLEFVDAAASERRITIARERLVLAEAALEAARDRVRAGRASPIETQRAEVAKLDAEITLTRIEREAQLVRARLARLTGLPQDSTIAAPWFERIDLDEKSVHGKTRPPAIAIAEAELAAAAARLDAARRGRVPDITLSAGMRHAEAPGDTAAVIGVAVPLPLFDSGRAAVARALAEVDLAEARRATAVREFEQARDTALAQLQIAHAAAAAASGPALAAAQELARIARIGYAAGKFSQLELIEAERVLGQSREATIDALAAYHQARARLRRLDGDLGGNPDGATGA